MHDPDSPTWLYVSAFAEAMEAKLSANRHKGDRDGWIKDSELALLKRLHEEFGELVYAVAAILNPDVILDEAADVANFAMMVAGRSMRRTTAQRPEAGARIERQNCHIRKHHMGISSKTYPLASGGGTMHIQIDVNLFELDRAGWEALQGVTEIVNEHAARQRRPAPATHKAVAAVAAKKTS